MRLFFGPQYFSKISMQGEWGFPPEWNAVFFSSGKREKNFRPTLTFGVGYGKIGKNYFKLGTVWLQGFVEFQMLILKLWSDSKLASSMRELWCHFDQTIWWSFLSPSTKSVPDIDLGHPWRLSSHSEFCALSDGEITETVYLFRSFVQGRYRASPRCLFSAHKSV